MTNETKKNELDKVFTNARYVFTPDTNLVVLRDGIDHYHFVQASWGGWVLNSVNTYGNRVKYNIQITNADQVELLDSLVHQLPFKGDQS